MFTDNEYGYVSLMNFMEKFYGCVTRIKFNVTEYSYDKSEGLKLLSKFTFIFQFKLRV
jgi:hypothetical protein